MVNRAATIPGVSSDGSALRTALIVLTPVAILLLGWFLVPVWGWLAVMALLVVFITLVGKHVAGVWRGALVDERNKISLSRLQTVLWTVLVVAGFLVAALHNIRSDQDAPLEIALPPQLWIVLGISMTSLVGSALVKQEKLKSSPELGNARKTLARALPGVEPEAVARLDDSNQLLVAADPDHPTVSDTVVARGVLAVNETKDNQGVRDALCVLTLTGTRP